MCLADFHMPYYHATWIENLEDIRKHGIRPTSVERKNFPGSPEGVYLATDPLIAVGFLVEALVERDDLRSSGSPAEDLARIRIIVVDDARIDQSKLTIDPVIDRPDIAFLYSGVVDISGSVVLDVNQVQEAFRVSHSPA